MVQTVPSSGYNIPEQSSGTFLPAQPSQPIRFNSLDGSHVFLVLYCLGSRINLIPRPVLQLHLPAWYIYNLNALVVFPTIIFPITVNSKCGNSTKAS